MRADMFITIIYATLDPATGAIKIARAGHEKPLVYDSKTKAAYFLKSRGIAVGMVVPAIFDSAIVDLDENFNPGDFLVLYTDGITEAVNPAGEEFGTERLRALLQNSAGRSSSDLCEHITREALAFTGRETFTDDDFTLLTIKRNS